MTKLKGSVFASRGAGRGRAGHEGRSGERVVGPRLKVPSGPLGSRTPPAGQGRRRHGLPGPFGELRGPAPETGRGRGQAGPAPQAAARSRGSCAPPPPGAHPQGRPLRHGGRRRWGWGEASRLGPQGPRSDPAPHSPGEGNRRKRRL